MEFIKDFTRKVTDTARIAAKKSSDMVEITKLNFNIGTEEDKIKKVYAQIGEIVYHSFEKGEEIPEDLKGLCEKIVASKKNIEKMKQQILRLKSIKICSSCNEELREEVVYCPKCGTRQEVDVAASEESKEENNAETCEQNDTENNTECSGESNSECNVEVDEEGEEANSVNEYQAEEDEEK
ncbi:zinc-ribbon domain-containing protein [Acetivibrio straminisolvens]|jgi:predicted RNA-binding Zn-ribbon protein involved in translation (DUF1610 family)|uniref:Zinc-ribbon domain-containing protein n=1 Tax=Acetivibrio straminisolvens JCM 21531 TaxID=1294263 RepID=W4VA66_9FIRM|nr:zinc-ribbon domain-containing protein [Acetivibrio straminisolvens]GAE90082.1 hypothetical protein JCM21531_3665 [Acetivibrio straminisolvens JCM 21531]